MQRRGEAGLSGEQGKLFQSSTKKSVGGKMTSNYVPEEFTDEEKELLAPFVTNVDKQVYGVRIHPLIQAAINTRISKSADSIRRILLDYLKKPEPGAEDLVETHASPDWNDAFDMGKAERLFDRVAGGQVTRHGTVLEQAPVCIVYEDISNLATKEVERERIGSPYLERSTRYVQYTDKTGGRFKFYRDPFLMASELGDEAEKVMNHCMALAAEIQPELQDMIRERIPWEDYVHVDTESGELTHVLDIHPADKQMIGKARRQYESTINNFAFDRVRGLFPAAIQSTVVTVPNMRTLSLKLNKWGVSPFGEMRDLVEPTREAVEAMGLGALLREEMRPDWVESNRLRSRAAAAEICPRTSYTGPTGISARILDITPEADVVVLSHMIFEHDNRPYEVIEKEVRSMGHEQKRAAFDALLGGRLNRFDKVDRGLEPVHLRIEMVLPFQVYRDLQRHRILSQYDQLLTTELGYHTPEEILEIGRKDDWDRAMEMVARLNERARGVHPYQSQYPVTFAFNKRFLVDISLREVFWMTELRSGTAGHEIYRGLMHSIKEQLDTIPELEMITPYMFVDMNKYPIGALNQERLRQLGRA